MRNYLTGKERLLVAALAFILPKRRFNIWLWVYFPEKGCHLGTNRSDNET